MCMHPYPFSTCTQTIAERPNWCNSHPKNHSTTHHRHRNSCRRKHSYTLAYSVSYVCAIVSPQTPRREFFDLYPRRAKPAPKENRGHTSMYVFKYSFILLDFSFSCFSLLFFMAVVVVSFPFIQAIQTHVDIVGLFICYAMRFPAFRERY